MQLDGCNKENKNKYFMPHLEYLVALCVFDYVEAGFILVGHMYVVDEQHYGQISDRLRHHNAMTPQDLHSKLRHTNNGTANVSHLEHIE